MVGIGDQSKLGSNTRPAPLLDNAAALAEIFRAFALAHYRIETGAPRRRPEQRAHSLRGCIIKAERLVDGCSDQRDKVEKTGNGVGSNHKILRQRSVDGRP